MISYYMALSFFLANRVAPTRRGGPVGRGVMAAVMVLCWCLVPGWLSAQPADDLEPYLLKPGDVIDISVWRDEALTHRLAVRPDGMISFPLIGEIRAAGRPVDAVREVIEERVAQYVPDKPVTVMLREIRYPKVYVIGKVNRPGVFTVEGEALTVLQALAMAGGLDIFADTDEILVLRQTADGQTAFRFNYVEVSRGRHLDQNIRLQPGDTVVVP